MLIKDIKDNKTDNKSCCFGKSQSPIDLPIVSQLNKNQKKIEFNFYSKNAKVLNTAETVKVEWNGSDVIVNGVKYKLLQFHFHWKSEHTINGKYFPLEMHLVYKAIDELLVLGILFDIDDNNENIFLEQFIHKIPDDENSSEEFLLKYPGGNIVEAWTYDGSLTTPPYLEGVKWFISKEIKMISSKQMMKLKKKNLPTCNNRDTCDRNDRNIDMVKIII